MYHREIKRAEIMLSEENPGVQDAWVVLTGSNETFWEGPSLKTPRYVRVSTAFTFQTHTGSTTLSSFGLLSELLSALCVLNVK